MSRQKRIIVILVAALVLVLVVWRWPKKAETPTAAASDAGGHVEVPTGRASVTVYDDGRPLADRWVVFHDASGAVLSSIKSSADGKAAGNVPKTGGMVTVAYGTSVKHLVTITGVESGDDLIVGEKDDEEGGGKSVATAKLKLPAGAPVPNAARYVATLGVGSTEVTSASPLSLPVLSRYLKDGKFPAYVVALDAASEPLAYTFEESALPDGAASIDVAFKAWRTDFREHRIVLTDAPDGMTNVRATLAFHIGEDRFEAKRRESTLNEPTKSLTFKVPRPLPETATYRLDLTYAGSADHVLHHARVKTMPAELRVNLREALLPRISKVTFDNGSIRWQASSLAAAKHNAHAIAAQVWWPETREHVWTILAPSNAAQPIKVPAVPAAMADWVPAKSPGPNVAVGLFGATEYAEHGYPDVRKKGIHLMTEPPEDDDASVSVSASGDLVF